MTYEQNTINDPLKEQVSIVLVCHNLSWGDTETLKEVKGVIQGTGMGGLLRRKNGMYSNPPCSQISAQAHPVQLDIQCAQPLK